MTELSELLKARDLDNQEAKDLSCYSTIGSIIALGSAFLYDFGRENIDLVGSYEPNMSFAERFTDSLTQVAASPVPVVIYYCMMTAAALCLFRAISARSDANNISKKLLEKEEALKLNNKHYNRLISSGSNDL
ncbi:hypothetical protein GF371_01255 [Candidatus Woesearchaeota archaeon]|nr:hypothetical protein [Candidatus Woesearchaeota archaeon]